MITSRQRTSRSRSRSLRISTAVHRERSVRSFFEQEVHGIAAPKRIKRKTSDTTRLRPANVHPTPSPGISVYDQIEAIIAALPEDMTEAARISAGELLKQLFTDYLDRRLELKGESKCLKS